MKTYKAVFAAAVVAAAVAGCDSDVSGVWRASVYAAGEEGKVLGEFATRDECSHAGMMHFGKDREEAHAKIARDGMSVGCTFVAAE